MLASGVLILRSSTFKLHSRSISSWTSPCVTTLSALEFVDGGSLAELVGREGALSERRIVRAVGDVLAGLAVLHEHGVIHRDVNPANVMVDWRSGAFKLSDWIGGEGEELSVSVHGKPVGTPVFMAPFISNKQAVDYFEALGYDAHKEEFCHRRGVFFYTRALSSTGKVCAEFVRARSNQDSKTSDLPKINWSELCMLSL